MDLWKIYTIPKVRQFYSAFHPTWQYRLNFCDLNQDSLKTVAMCCLASFASVARDGRSLGDVSVEPMELFRFVANDFGPINAMCDRTKEVMESFGFPFDAPRPPKQESLRGIEAGWANGWREDFTKPWRYRWPIEIIDRL